jgi:hypothetical protein
MKTTGLMMVLAALLGLLLAGVTSCTTQGKETVARLGNVALTAGVISGRITPAQAELVRKHGALLLAAETQEAQVAAISAAALAAAVETGALSSSEASQLKAAGEVPVPDDPPVAVVVESTATK